MTVVSDRFDPKVRAGNRIEIVTPEGVPLAFTIASVGERAYAFMFDAVCIAAVMLSIWLLLGITGLGNVAVISAFATLVFFVLRNGWFTLFELRDLGRTPGKRSARLRVIDARGGALQPMSLVIRNLTRELEIVLPFAVLAYPELITSAGPGWVRVASGLWGVGIGIVPLIDRRRRRLGDLLAGTMVVREPRPALERDLADLGAGGRGVEVGVAGGFAFTTHQLAMYGVYELQVLEQVLRDEPRASRTLEQVADRIVAKIGWEGSRERGRARAFLEAFYRAQRARLEHDLSLGRARERKQAGRLGG